MTDTITLQQRIAMLNMQHVRAPGVPSPATKPDRPPPPPRSASTDASLDAMPVNRTRENQPAAPVPVGRVRQEPKLLPPHPPRPLAQPSNTSKPKPPPSLPPRAPSNQALVRRDSTESTVSTVSTTSTHLTPSISNTSRRPSVENRTSSERVKAPVYDPSTLPALPPKKAQTQQRPSPSTGQKSFHSQPRPTIPSRPTAGQGRPNSTHADEEVRSEADIPAPSLPPRRPSEPAPKQTPVSRPAPTINHTNSANPPKRSALDFGLNKGTNTAPTIPQRPGSVVPTSQGTQPPPVPHGSRPDLSAIQASKPKFSTTTKSYAVNAASCMKCRDFSGPDNHAARFPREGIPTQDLKWLAGQLTSPFPSATDKARAVFTWLHHNIAYNTKDFFGGTMKCCTPADTMVTGSAVCAGYADLFSALCMHAGLECVVVGGHGKGFGHTAIKPGDPIPSFECGHAWNAVKIDNGEWKLVDACWGAGHVDGATQQYVKKFNASEFIMSNEEFGLKHYPENPAYFFRADGRVVAWEEYLLGPEGQGEAVTPCSQVMGEYGLNPNSFLPSKKVIRTRGVPPNQRIQFRFSTVCEHWDHMAKGTGPPYCFILQIGGKDGRERDFIPFNCDPQARNWWAEVAVQDLGCPGQTVSINAVTTVAGKDARGLSAQDYKAAKGRKAMSWMGCVSYQLA